MCDSEKRLAITGYVDRWSAHAGEKLRFYVSSEEPRYSVQLVRLLHGEASDSSGLTEEAVAASINGEFDGQEQDIATGSCMQVEAIPARTELALIGYVMSTLTCQTSQTAVSWRFDDGLNVRIDIDAAGRGTLVCQIGASDAKAQAVDLRIDNDQWYRFALLLDRKTGRGKTINLWHSAS